VHRPTFRRARRSLALGVALAAVLAVVGPLAQAGAAGGNEESFATLRVTADTVSVKAKGEDDFKKAKDGDEVHAGDTVRTDATGKAEIEYGDDAYTRLDSNTTFKITKLTDDEGNRQVEGTIESGKTWNRTAALTESESFEQTGADATAAVEGTAFAVECDAVDHCVFTGVVDDVSLTGADGVKKLLNPLDECDSSSGVLCGDITQISADDLPQWILDNLILDVARGYDFPFGGTVVVQGSQVFFVPDEATPPPPPNPVVDPNPTIITDLEVSPTPDPVADEDDEGSVVYSEDEATTGVKFMLQVTDTSGGSFWVVFTDLPASAIGELYDSGGTLVNLVTQYDPATEVFEFRPQQYEPTCVSPTFDDCFDNYPDASGDGAYEDPALPTGYVAWSDTFTFKAQNSLGGESPEVQVTVTVVDDICATGNEGSRPAAESVTTCP